MNLIKYIFPAFLLFSALNSYPQVTGCTDKKALNYNSNATVNNGSCTYKLTHHYPAIINPELPSRVHETSGLLIVDGDLWTHNDSGGDAALYVIDPKNNKIRQTITITNAVNNDWEDITHDEDYIYIADLGNNAGTRKDLSVIRIPRAGISGKNDVEVTGEFINLSYADQTRYMFNPRNHNFDCEAIISYGDSLYLFSKNWQDEMTRIYSVPKNPGDYLLYPRAEYDADGLITGAAVSPNGKEITLIGYKDFVSFIIVLWDFDPYNFLSGNKRKVIFPDLVVVQTEGVDYYKNGVVWITAESSAVPQSLYSVETRLWTDPSFKYPGYEPPEGFRFDASYNDKTGTYTYTFFSLPDNKLKIEIYDSTWKKIRQDKLQINYNLQNNVLEVDTREFSNGLYYIKLISDDKFVVREIVVQ